MDLLHLLLFTFFDMIVISNQDFGENEVEYFGKLKRKIAELVDRQGEIRDELLQDINAMILTQ